MVTTVEDESDGACDAHCSLREALAFTTSDAVIVVPAGTYFAESASFALNGNRAIVGAGAGATRLSGPGRRVVMVASGSPTVTGVRIGDGSLSLPAVVPACTWPAARPARCATALSTTTPRRSAPASTARSTRNAVRAQPRPGQRRRGLVRGGWRRRDRQWRHGHARQRHAERQHGAGIRGGLHVEGSGVVTLQNVTFAENTWDGLAPWPRDLPAVRHDHGDQHPHQPHRRRSVSPRHHDLVDRRHDPPRRHELRRRRREPDLWASTPSVSSLTDNGGPTATHALMAGSPAIDAGAGPCPRLTSVESSGLRGRLATSAPTS